MMREMQESMTRQKEELEERLQKMVDHRDKTERYMGLDQSD